MSKNYIAISATVAATLISLGINAYLSPVMAQTTIQNGDWVQTGKDQTRLFRIHSPELGANDQDQSDAGRILLIDGRTVEPGQTVDVVLTGNATLVLQSVETGRTLMTVDLNNLQPGATWSADFIAFLAQSPQFAGKYMFMYEAKGFDVVDRNGNVAFRNSPSDIQPGDVLNLTYLNPDGTIKDNGVVLSGSPDTPNTVNWSNTAAFSNKTHLQGGDSTPIEINIGDRTATYYQREVVKTEVTTGTTVTTNTGNEVTTAERTVGGETSTEVSQRTDRTAGTIEGTVEFKEDTVVVEPVKPLEYETTETRKNPRRVVPDSTVTGLVRNAQTELPDGTPLKAPDGSGNAARTSGDGENNKLGTGLMVRIGAVTDKGGNLTPQGNVLLLHPFTENFHGGVNFQVNGNAGNTPGATVLGATGILGVNTDLLTERKREDGTIIRDARGNALMRPTNGQFYLQGLGTVSLGNYKTEVTDYWKQERESRTPTTSTFTVETRTPFERFDTFNITTTYTGPTARFLDTTTTPWSQDVTTSTTTTSQTQGTQNRVDTSVVFPSGSLPNESSSVTGDVTWGPTSTSSTSSVNVGDRNNGTSTTATSLLGVTSASSASSEVLVNSQEVLGQTAVISEPVLQSVEAGPTTIANVGSPIHLGRSTETKLGWSTDFAVRGGYTNVLSRGAVAGPGTVLFDAYAQYSPTNVKNDSGVGGMLGVVLASGVNKDQEGRTIRTNDRALSLDGNVFVNGNGVNLAAFLSLRAVASGNTGDRVALNAGRSVDQYVAQRDLQLLESLGYKVGDNVTIGTLNATYQKLVVQNDIRAQQLLGLINKLVEQMKAVKNAQ